MKLQRYTCMAVLALPLTAASQTITFDTDDYRAIGVYDTWEASPFRTHALEGNAAVTANPFDGVDENLGHAPNSTPKVLAVQRSRFGSNTFGARIDLKESFELTPVTRYVHVLIHKPIAGRAMLIGLGKRPERADQSPETEQFWALATAKVRGGQWTDAVFAIKGNGGIDIHSLVVVPDCESPHRLSEDFAAYIDEIIINDSAEPRFIVTGEYGLNFDEEQAYTRNDRHLDGVSLATAEGLQRRTPAEARRMYNASFDRPVTVRAGETVSPSVSYTGNWMNAYVYLDRGNDGKFNWEDLPGSAVPAGSDIMSYSHYKEHDSQGNPLSNRNTLTMPAFTIPAELTPGFYRMRFKVDWDCIDPAGNRTEDNNIVHNGGGVIDVLLNVHTDECRVNDANRNGAVLAADGTKLNDYKAPFGQPFRIRMEPENGFSYNGIRVRHGYNLAGDSLVCGNPQYRDTVILSNRFAPNGEYTIPGHLMDGDVEIEGLFVEKGTELTYVNLTYRLVDENGEEILRTTQSVQAGSAYPPFEAPATECSSAYYEVGGVPDGTVGDEDHTLDISYRSNFPFRVSPDVNHAYWHTLTLSAHKYLLHDNGTQSHIALSLADAGETPEATYQWCFVGNAFTGFKIYNSQAGPQRILSSTTRTADGNTGGNTFPTLRLEPVADDCNTYWAVTPGRTLGGTQGFFLAQAGQPANRMNLRDGKLAYWTGGADEGSTFLVQPVSLEPGPPSAIGEIRPDSKAGDSVHDLRGHRVARPGQGIYIRNREKIYHRQ